MHIIPLIFAISEVLGTIFYKRFYFYIQFFSQLINNPQDNKTKVILLDKMALFFLVSLIMHFSLLAYCLYLMVAGSWQPACMLLLLSALESYAVKANISGATIKSSRGFTYPTILFKTIISSLTLFILLNLSL